MIKGKEINAQSASGRRRRVPLGGEDLIASSRGSFEAAPDELGASALRAWACSDHGRACRDASQNGPNRCDIDCGRETASSRSTRSVADELGDNFRVRLLQCGAGEFVHSG
jgi:hypothetical protein